MRSAKLLPLSHWIALIIVGFYPLYSAGEINYWPWIVTVTVLAVLGIAYHAVSIFMPRGRVSWWGLSLLAMDAILICFLIYYSGGISSPFFPLLFLLSATAALYGRWTIALMLAGIISAGYITACFEKGLQLNRAGPSLLVNVSILFGASVLLSYLAELNRREQSKAERMEALYRLSSEFIESVDLKETLERLLSSTASFFDTDISSICLLDTKTGTLRLEASGTPLNDTNQPAEIAIGEGIIGWVAKEKSPILVNDVSGDSRFSDFPRSRRKIRSAMAAPILVGGELVGVLSFADTIARSFTPEDLQMLVTISNLSATVIARAKLYEILLSRSEVIMDSMSSGLLVTDTGGKVIMANQAARDMLGLEGMPGDISLKDLLEPNLLDTEVLWEYMDSDLPHGDDFYANLEMRLRGTPERILSVRVSPIRAGYEPNSGTVVILEDITERVKVDEIRDDLMLLIARRVEEQTALYEVGRSLIDEVDTRNLREFLLTKAVDLVDGHLGVLSLYEGQGLYRIKAVQGLDAKLSGTSFLPGEYLSGEAVEREEPLRFANVDPELAGPWGHGLGDRVSYLAAPITWQGKITGMIEVASPWMQRAFGDDDLRLLSLFVNQAAIAMENSNLYRLITEDQQRMEAMLHSINDGVIAVSNEARIILVNAAAESILKLPPSHHISEHHVKEVIRHTGLANIFLKSLNTSEELDEEVHLGPPDRKILEVRTSLIETGPGERIGIIAVIRDVTALRELEQAKSDFVSTVSHELRTPLTSIKAYTATLRRGDVEFDEGTRQEFLKVVEEETDRLTRLISDVLDVSRIESGKMEIKKRDFDLARLVGIVTDKMQSQALNHRIVLISPESIGAVNADPDKIEQVVMNLLDNAIKYSPSGGEVTLRLEVEHRRVEIMVSDEGVGIPADQIPHIFEKFHRVDNRATREVYGTGLGLYVTKSIVEAHDGTIWAESELGRGSTFHFTLPLSSRQNPADQTDIQSRLEEEADVEEDT